MSEQAIQVRVGPLLLNQQRCKKCGVCVELCPRQVFTISDEGYPEPSNIERCTGCKLCELWCPDYAIEVEVSEDAG
ncbi:NAD(P)H-quinone oxidoreductase subunit I, chloroplastic [subsurface metagenome]